MWCTYPWDEGRIWDLQLFFVQTDIVHYHHVSLQDLALINCWKEDRAKVRAPLPLIGLSWHAPRNLTNHCSNAQEQFIAESHRKMSKQGRIIDLQTSNWQYAKEETSYTWHNRERLRRNVPPRTLTRWEKKVCAVCLLMRQLLRHSTEVVFSSQY